ncbi:MAG: glycine cleavage system protein GcvH [Ottowia sp.]|nr:glycine cleavage system protein GcvH [Ottowia sp.]
MSLPNELKYTASHEWVRTHADGSVTVGITDHAQAALGDVVFLELPTVGSKLNAGQACAVVESVKAASDIYAPLAGKVLAINEAVSASPEEVNNDAYTAWLFRLQPAQVSDIDKLMSAQDYATAIGV